MHKIRQTYQTLQMLHEDLQADIIGKNRLTCPTRRAVHAPRHVRRRWVQLRQQESSLTASLVADDIAWDGEAIHKQLLRVGDWRLEKLLEILIPFLILIPGFSPLRNCLAVENEDVEECVKQEYDVRLDGNAVEKDRLWRGVEGIRHKRRLNHNK